MAPYPATTSFIPSEEAAIVKESFALKVLFHKAPPSVLEYMTPSPDALPPSSSLEPSDEDVMERQSNPTSGNDVVFHDDPPLTLKRTPKPPHTAITAPSEEDVIGCGPSTPNDEE